MTFTKEEISLAEQSRVVYLGVTEARLLCVNQVMMNLLNKMKIHGIVIVPMQTIYGRTFKRIKDRAKKRAKVDIAKECLLRRKTTKCARSVEMLYPGIGEVMERIAESCDIEADKWRRTGVYTFSGDPKKCKRLTFKRLQLKLIDHYGCHFSYGTVVQLCVAKNKKRLSSKRYKGLAKMKYQ